MTDRPNDMDPPAQRIAETRARQGFRDRPVLMVLAVSLLLAVLALFGLWAAQSGDMESTRTDAEAQRDARAFDQPQQPAKGD